MDWLDFDSNINLVLKDDSFTNYPSLLRMLSYNWAIKNVVWYEPKEKQTTLSLGSRSYALPSDFVEVVAVWDGSGWPSPMNFDSSNWTSMPDPTTNQTAFDRSYWLFGGNLNFTKALTIDGILYYHGEYTPVTDTGDTLDIPARIEQAIEYWTIAGCMNPKITQQGRLGIWGETIATGLSRTDAVGAYEFYWKKGIEILEAIVHKEEEMTLIARSRRVKV